MIEYNIIRVRCTALLAGLVFTYVVQNVGYAIQQRTLVIQSFIEWGICYHRGTICEYWMSIYVYLPSNVTLKRTRFLSDHVFAMSANQRDTEVSSYGIFILTSYR